MNLRGRIDALTGKKGGDKEVQAAISRLFTYAAWADKYDGQAHGVPIRGVALAMKEPVGVIGAICADDTPLAGPCVRNGTRHCHGQPRGADSLRSLPAGGPWTSIRFWKPPMCQQV